MRNNLKDSKAFVSYIIYMSLKKDTRTIIPKKLDSYQFVDKFETLP